MQNRLLYLKREDQIHPLVSGNKLRKLSYNITEALYRNNDSILTFGGAYSNHILATAKAGHLSGLRTIGVIRGQELATTYKSNPTLKLAEDYGMSFHFVSRDEYKLKDTVAYVAKLSAKYPNTYILPEGGTNMLAIKGCGEILNKEDAHFDYICIAVGTGGTLAGLVKTSKPHQTIIGYSALKGTFQVSEVKKFTSKTNFLIKDDYCFGGYAKIDSELIRFMNQFKEKTNILLDPVYTAKMLYGIFKDIEQGFFPENSRILAIHTGGLQGINGMNKLLEKKKLPQIKT